MTRTPEETIAALDAYTPDGDDWRSLDTLLGEVASAELVPAATPALIGLFERHPESDGAGVFWAVVQLLETEGGYEPLLVQSLKRNPTEFGVIMAGRLLNSGVLHADETPLLPLLESIAASAETPYRIRKLAIKFSERHVGMFEDE